MKCRNVEVSKLETQVSGRKVAVFGVVRTIPLEFRSNVEEIMLVNETDLCFLGGNTPSYLLQ